MASQIEKMNRMRRNILLGILIGTGIAFGWFMLPSFHLVENSFRSAEKAFIGGFIVWLSTLLIFGTIYLLYKRKLKKDPSLRAAVSDERVKLNWLRAYRFSFFITVSITIIWKWLETAFSPRLLMLTMRLPDGPQFVLYVAVISLIGSFLHYNREA